MVNIARGLRRRQSELCLDRPSPIGKRKRNTEAGNGNPFLKYLYPAQAKNEKETLRLGNGDPFLNALHPAQSKIENENIEAGKGHLVPEIFASLNKATLLTYSAPKPVPCSEVPTACASFHSRRVFFIQP